MNAVNSQETVCHGRTSVAACGNQYIYCLLIRPNVDLKMKKAESARYYFASVTGVDRAFGQILETLKEMGLDKNTVVIFASDHGETMCSQRTDDPKNSPYSESMNIPFLVRFPDKIQPRVDDLLLSAPDIMPTVLGLCGLGDSIPAEVQGRNFAPLFFDEKAEIYQFMAEKAEEENRPEEANIFHKKEKIMQDSALARKKTEEMLSLQNEYDNMKKDERTGHRIGMIIIISASALLFFAISSVFLFRRRANRTRRQITEIRKETDKYQRELENAERTSRGDKKEIERLRKKLEQGEARLSAILDRGKDLYDSVKLDGNVSRWSKDDFEAVVEYLRAKMPDEVRMIEETHTKLTAYATFFLLLSAIGMDAADTARIMGISQGAVRTMRHRLKKKEKSGNNN